MSRPSPPTAPARPSHDHTPLIHGYAHQGLVSMKKLIHLLLYIILSLVRWLIVAVVSLVFVALYPLISIASVEPEDLED
jgi:hypothetical protein